MITLMQIIYQYKVADVYRLLSKAKIYPCTSVVTTSKLFFENETPSVISPVDGLSLTVVGQSKHQHICINYERRMGTFYCILNWDLGFRVSFKVRVSFRVVWGR